MFAYIYMGGTSPKTVEWKRARTTAQVEERVKTIMTACETLLTQSPPQDLKMREIAKASDLAVGAIYRYFRCKELLILSVYLDKMQDLLDELALFSSEDRRLETFAEHMAEVFVNHTFFWYLSTFAGTILETNLSDDEVRDHKTSAMAMTSQCIERLVECVPEMTAEEMFDLFMDSFFYTCGLYPFAFPPENIGAILEDPNLQGFRPSWESSVRRMLHRLLGV